MKVAFFTDTHFSATRPRMRTDENWIETQQKKQNEILKILKEKNVELVLEGGDLFDEHNPDHIIVNSVINFHKRITVPVFSVVGNHDMIGGNLSELNRTGFGVVKEAGVLNLLDENVVEFKSFALKGMTYKQTNEYDLNWMFPESNLFKVIVAHSMVLPVDNLPYDFIHPDDIKTNADLVLLGHFHSPFIWKSNNTTFVNPGSVLRLAASQSEVREPAIFIFDEIGKFETIPILNINENPFDWSKLKAEKQAEQIKINIKESFNKRISGITLEEKIKSICTEDDVLNEAFKRLNNAKEILDAK